MDRSSQMKDHLPAVALRRKGVPTSGFLYARQLRAEEQLLLVLVGFAGSVIATRSFLEWANCPQIATAQLHIAHVLWGGLLLFAAALLLLIWRGRTIYRLSSVLTGIGFGLFIDEVGKFITQSNDYFYPLAAPIIYAFFLLTVLIYLGVRHSEPGGRTELPRVVALLEAAADPGISREQQKALRAELAQLARTAEGSGARLAAQAEAFLEAEGIEGSGHEGRAADVWARARTLLSQWLTAVRLQRMLTWGFALLSLRGLVSGLAALFFTISIWDLERWQQLGIPATPLSSGGPFTTAHLVFVSLTLTFEGIVGALFAAATILMIRGRRHGSLALAYWGLLLSLTAVRFLALYFNQFDVILTTLLQFALLLGVIRYRSHYLAAATSES